MRKSLDAEVVSALRMFQTELPFGRSQPVFTISFRIHVIDSEKTSRFCCNLQVPDATRNRFPSFKKIQNPYGG